MTPKEKAKELIDKYFELSIVTTYNGNDEKEIAKQCALIAVDKYLEDIKTQRESVEDLTANTLLILQYNRWQEVKQEIENYEE